MTDDKDTTAEADPRLEQHVRSLSRGARNLYGRAVDAVAPPADRLTETVKAQPLASVALAAVTGAMFAKMRGGRRIRRRF